ncbi:phosphoethanolamine methyltransferase [Rhodospirillaceae bacterium SYSU D60014]|uniref:phosphoethanolamine methyltransferase n=1 Tax=Virgifigura deserti TaxID=2268457 RepID=UPI000E6628B3
MVRGTERSKPQRAVAGKIPFRLRLKAWWDGNELYLRRRKRDRRSHGKDTLTRQKGYRDPERPWDSPRVRMLQAVWGEGFCAPGGPDHILELVKPFGLTPAMSMLHLGAGLGGPARTIAGEFGVWIAGFESDHELAQAGAALSNLAGMAKKAMVAPFDLQKFELSLNSCDAIFADSIFFPIVDKHRLMRILDLALKERGQLLFTDYVLTRRGGEESPEIQAWMKQEPVAPHPWTAQEYTDFLADLKLDIRITEDVTAAVRSMIIQGWANFTATASAGDLDPEMASCLTEEVNLWTSRVAAFDSGELRVYRIYALKKVAEKMLSDW